MVEYQLSSNPGGQYYIPKEVREALGKELTLIPNSKSAVLYPRHANLGSVIKSVKIILQDLELRHEDDKKVAD